MSSTISIREKHEELLAGRQPCMCHFSLNKFQSLAVSENKKYIVEEIESLCYLFVLLDVGDAVNFIEILMAKFSDSCFNGENFLDQKMRFTHDLFDS